MKNRGQEGGGRQGVFDIHQANHKSPSLAYAEFRLILARIMWNFEIEIAQQSQDWMQQQQSYLLWQKPALFAHLVSKRGRE